METRRRACERHETIGLMSSLWDGKTACMGIVEDVSPAGLKIAQVPTCFNDSRSRCFSIVHGPVDDFKILLQPRWKKSTRKGMYKCIGFKIEKPTADWKKFVNGFNECNKPSDIYKTVTGSKQGSDHVFPAKTVA